MNDAAAGFDVIGRPLDRVDGPLKATGSARYAAEFSLPRLCHGVVVQSTIPSGRITALDVRDAEASPGVLLVMTFRNAPALPQRGRAAVNPPAGRAMSLLQSDEVRYNGEPIAVVVAETFESATGAAARIKATYAPSQAMLDFDRAKGSATVPAVAGPTPADVRWGDVAAGMAQAEVRVDAVYSTPMEHHNPMEPHATIASWSGDELLLYDTTQYVSGVRQTVAKTLGMPLDKVRVVCPYVGGGFGCKGSVWSHVVLAAMAARQVRRPVKIVLARPQMFGPVGGRPRTEQHVVLGARRDGHLVAVRHDVVSHTSQFEDFTEPSSAPTRVLYACANGTTSHRLARLNVGTPTFQRAPGLATGTFALEVAMDELAIALGVDPVELRLRNDTDREPSTGKPFTLRRFRACYEDGARRFGWSKRSPAPGSMRDGKLLIGWGVASATYPAHSQPASALATLLPDGSALVQSGSQDLGTGTYTIMTQIAAEALGLPVERVRFELGDTSLPAAPVSGGSMTAASVGPAVVAACNAVRDKLVALAVKDEHSPLKGLRPQQVRIADGALVATADATRREEIAAVLARRGQPLVASGDDAPDPTREKMASHSFGAVFAEVRVDPDFGTLRIPRIVATYDVGRRLNAKTAQSQLQGGIVWGVSLALQEHSILDRRTGRFVNANLAEYHVPVNADIGLLDVAFIDEPDTRFNVLGARGIGEIGITGVAAALANAVHHATGKRIRDLPITLDKLV
jgi:xanthine dehydrogenase YagR molybdenum-binding subunit